MNNFLDFLFKYFPLFQNSSKSASAIGGGIAILAGFGAALAQGYIGGKAVEALARNPEVEALIFKQYIVAVAICESVAIYALIVAIIVIFK
ncbi:hypothetical protein PRV_01255 [Mycoplasma parvum str. Indiana]|uniref:ATP synthase subunit c n=1 Tax=Mycoplasma parvum str. Indiana TaxID=1403316 RepID=U5NFK5_9MOLU|nr:hypothetical protein PRV_01255 [Mycoplasma parvum str. Indiana]